jgi:hypothetical protein
VIIELNMPLVLAVALCALVSGGQAKTDGKESVRIYVFATQSPGDASDEAQERRLLAVRELRDALRRKAGLTVVDDRAQADVFVEVTDREEQSLGEGGFGGAKLTKLVTTTIRLHVVAGDHDTEMKGTGTGAGTRAAKDAADRLLKWIARNRLRPSAGSDDVARSTRRQA